MKRANTRYEYKPLELEYSELQPTYAELCKEVRFIMETRLRKQNIEVSQVQFRVKTLESFLEKAERKLYMKPLVHCSDIAGVRVVCLYADDVPKIEKVVSENFTVVETVDKSNHDVDRFGYLARHFVVKLTPTVSGARYHELKNLRCEIQVRTVLQDAWAIVDHHLRYKRQAEIPSTLTRSVNGLAAVLEMADKQFNSLLKERDSYKRRLNDRRRSLNSLLSEELNRDSLRAYLARKFPGLSWSASDTHYETAVRNLDFRKYKTLGDLELPFLQTEKIRAQYQRDEYSKSALSQLAIALACVDDKYWRATTFGPEASALIKKYRRMVRKRLTSRRRRKASRANVAPVTGEGAAQKQ